jgi:hypothetical protein
MAIAQRTRKILWTRAADRCAICRCKLTKDPRHSNDREAVLGMECHIVARGKKGPRSGPITPNELDDYRNLILLCPTHHKEVDDQPAEYTIERLREIKREHEEWVDETLEWRAGLPESFWEQVKKEAEELLVARSEEVEGGIDELVEGLGVFVLMTAELLASPELVFFVRGRTGQVALALKYEEGSVLFAHAEFDGFDGGFSSFHEAPAIEDCSNEVKARAEGKVEKEGEEDGMGIFLLAGSALLRTAQMVQGGEAVFYIRETPPSEAPQLAFLVEDEEDVLFAAGPAAMFDEAHDEFAAADPVDITESVRAKMFLDTYTQAMEEEDEIKMEGFIANYFAISLLKALEAGKVGDEERARFAELLRDRFYEAQLMLRAAHRDSEDPRIRAWIEDNLDPRPPDGLRAALPEAMYKAVREFAEEIELDEKHQSELEEEALDLLYRAISLFYHFDDYEEEQEPLAILLIKNLDLWRNPVPREEIAEMAGL